MKKTVSLVLALALCLALDIPAFAAAPTDFDAIELSIEDGMACESEDRIALWKIERNEAEFTTKEERVTYAKPGARFHAKNLNPNYKFRIYYHEFTYHPAPEILEFPYASDEHTTLDIGGQYVCFVSYTLVAEYFTNFLRNDGSWNGDYDSEEYPDAVGGTYYGGDGGVLVLENEKEITFTLPENGSEDAYYMVCAEIEKEGAQEDGPVYEYRYFVVRFDSSKVKPGDSHQSTPQAGPGADDAPKPEVQYTGARPQFYGAKLFDTGFAMWGKVSNPTAETVSGRWGVIAYHDGLMDWGLLRYTLEPSSTLDIWQYTYGIGFGSTFEESVDITKVTDGYKVIYVDLNDESDYQEFMGYAQEKLVDDAGPHAVDYSDSKGGSSFESLYLGNNSSSHIDADRQWMREMFGV